ncbi:ATP-binding cassette domain-containing protein [Alkalibacillus silvisoli]|uniref:ATP-binding cassette domain-containing protein n=2 Tax=Alkalibacillus silvisoli TaxID=392823 RepID=A0ABN0ZZ49_9BACI
MTQTILNVENLSKTFSTKNSQIDVVRDVNFEVNRGEIFGFLGPNGAGKTTTMGMLTTQIRPTSGEIILAEKSIWGNLTDTRKRISIVTQHNNLDRGLTARENLLFHARYFNLPSDEAAKRADRFLDLMDLTERADDRVVNFSGGMAQRLKIARALMHDPDILFLDEPTTGLDPQSRVLLWEEIKKLNAQGTTIFLTTHYMEEPEQLCDRVAILHEGQLKALNTPEELKKLVPGQNVVSVRTGDVRDELLSEAKTLPEVEDATAEMGTLRFYMKDATPDLGELVKWLRSQDVNILSMNLHLSTLNDVFVHLTGKGLEQR